MGNIIFINILSRAMAIHEFLLKDDVYNLFVNAHVRIKRYQEFYHSYIYINENNVTHVKTGYKLWLP
jgi:hypothetical protein